MSQHRRRIIVINRPFQFRFSLYVVSWVFVLSLVYPSVIYGIFEYFEAQFLSLVGRVPPEVFVEVKSQIFWSLVGLQAVFLGAIFVMSLFVSFRIAGPIYKLQKTFREIREGTFQAQRIQFRDKDHFFDLAEDFNSMLGALRQRRSSTVHQLDLAMNKIESSPLPETDKADLRAILTQAKQNSGLY